MHFLKMNERHGRELHQPRACVNVRLVNKTTLELVPDGPSGTWSSISVLNLGTRLAELPDRMSVLGLDGKVIKPSRGSKFYVTVETIDPLHAVTEMPD